MFSDEMIEEMADDVHRWSKTHATDQDGDRLVICSAASLGFHKSKEMVVIYENRGALFFELDRPMNAFRLASAGISMRVAPEVSDMLNRLIAAVGKRIEAGRPALLGTSPTEKEDTDHE